MSDEQHTAITTTTGAQEPGEEHEVQPGQHLRQPLIVTSQPPGAGDPGERALNHPATGQEHEATLGFRQLDDFQADALRLGGLSRLVAGVALVDPGQLDVLAGHLLHLLGQRFHLGALVLVGWRHGQRQELAERIHRQVHFRALAPLVPAVARAAQTDAVHVLARVHRLGDGALREVRRQRELHQDAVHAVVGVERLDGGAQGGVIRLGGQRDDAGRDTDGLGGPRREVALHFGGDAPATTEADVERSLAAMLRVAGKVAGR